MYAIMPIEIYPINCLNNYEQRITGRPINNSVSTSEFWVFLLQFPLSFSGVGGVSGISAGAAGADGVGIRRHWVDK